MPFPGQIAVPARHDHQQILRSVRHTLARQARLSGQPVGCVEPVFFLVAGLVAGVEALRDDHVAGAARAHAASGVLDLHPVGQSDIEQAARFPLLL